MLTNKALIIYLVGSNFSTGVICLPNQIYKREQFIIVEANNQFVVENTNYSKGRGSHKHSHFFYNKSNKSNVFNNCKRLIHYAINKEIPKNCNLRFLGSLIRITDDEQYAEKVRRKKEALERKGPRQKYINVQKGVRR